MGDNEEPPTTTSALPLAVGPISRPQAPPAVHAKRGVVPASSSGARSLRTELSASGRKLQQRAWTVVSMVLASTALFAPWWALVAALSGWLLMSAFGRAHHGGRKGTADLVVVPLALLWGAARAVLSLLNPLRLIKVLLVVCLALAVSVAIAGGVGWILTDAGDADYAIAKALGARLAVWTYAPRILAAVLCFAMMMSLSKTSRLRASFNAVVLRMSENQLTVAALGTVSLLLIVPLATDHGIWAPYASASEFARTFPVPRLAEAAAAMGRSEAESTLQCFNGKFWNEVNNLDQTSAESTLRSGSLDVRIDVPKAVALSEPQRLALLLALHNQLPPWVDSVTVGSGKGITLDRRGLPRDKPVLELNSVRDSIKPHLAKQATIGDLRQTVIECALRAP